MSAIRIGFLYADADGDDTPISQVELFVSGPAAACGHIYDALTGTDRDGRSAGKRIVGIDIDPESEVPERLKEKL